MPAPFNVQRIRKNNGIRQVHLTLDLGQPNDVYLNVTGEVLAGIFGDDVREGDIGTLAWELLKRPGTNGTKS